MKVNVWSINYAPECTGIGLYTTQLCDYLVGKGHSIDVVTAFAYYPSWEKRSEDRGRLYRNDRVGDVRVHRCWQYVPARVRTITRMLHELSFIATSFLRQLLLPAPDVYVVASPPLLLGIAVRLLSWIKRRKYVFWVLDLQPDAALGMGMVKPGPLIRFLFRCEAMAYRGAARVCGLCDGMLDAFRQKGVPERKIHFFPVWFDKSEFDRPPEPGAFRKRLGLPSDAFLAIYSGNIGVKQGIEILVEAAPLLENSSIRIIICGDGAVRPALESMIRDRQITNVLLRPLVPRDQYLEMLADTDVALITQQAGSGAYFFPNKILVSLAAGNPVLTVADEHSELFRAMEKGDFGWNVLPGDAKGLAETLLEVAGQKDLIEEKTRNGLAFVEAYEQRNVLPAFESMLLEISKGRRPAVPA